MDLKTEARTSDEEISGVKNAIRGFVEAKKGEARAVDKGKKRSLLVSALKRIFKRKNK